MTDRFHCPVQNPAAFSFDACMSCRYFQLSKNLDGSMNISCRKNSKKKDRLAAMDFEGAFLLHRLGMEYHVEIIEQEQQIPKQI